MVVIKLFSHVLPHLINFVNLFGLQLLNKIKSCLLVVCHILVPSISELLILQPLCILNIDELPLLRNPHIVVLAPLLILTPPVKYLLVLVSHHVISN